MAGAYLFGAALALSPALQARGYGINQFALDAIPYVVTILVLVVLGRKRAARRPRGPAQGLRDGARHADPTANPPNASTNHITTPERRHPMQ